MNRKLIRTTLAEVKGRETTHPRERSEMGAPRPPQHRTGGGAAQARESSAAAAMGRKKIPQAERARGVREQLRVADDDGRARLEHLALGDGLEDDFGADAGGVAHRDADARATPDARALG